MHPADNVAIVVRDIDAGTPVDAGITLTERIPQGHKVLLENLEKGSEIRRYNVVIGHLSEDLLAGSWVNEVRLTIP